MKIHIPHPRAPFSVHYIHTPTSTNNFNKPSCTFTTPDAVTHLSDTSALIFAVYFLLFWDCFVWVAVGFGRSFLCFFALLFWFLRFGLLGLYTGVFLLNGGGCVLGQLTFFIGLFGVLGVGFGVERGVGDAYDLQMRDVREIRGPRGW